MNGFTDINVVLVSCENKNGLVDNYTNSNLPNSGILGYLADINKNIVFLSSGGTYDLIKNQGLNVIDFEEYTSSPQMKGGLVKSIDYKIHSSILAQNFIQEDLNFLAENDLLQIDAVFTNFNMLDIDNIKIIDTFAVLEKFRNRIDIGGPLMCMTSRKAFLNTLLVTDPRDYFDVIKTLKENNGKCPFYLRVRMLKKSTHLLNEYQTNISRLYNKVSENLLDI